VRVLEFTGGCQYFCREVKGEAFLDTEGNVLIALMWLDLDEVVFLKDIYILLEFVYVPTDGRAMDSQTSSDFRTSEPFGV